jgi:hypothetical protein
MVEHLSHPSVKTINYWSVYCADNLLCNTSSNSSSSGGGAVVTLVVAAEVVVVLVVVVVKIGGITGAERIMNISFQPKYVSYITLFLAETNDLSFTLL